MMAKPAKLYQPAHVNSFHCIGSACEDTCCVGWTIHVDKSTFGKYQACSDSHFGSSLQTLVQINQKSASDDDYAHIALSAATCPFLADGLCSIQHRLGEAYLSNMCATYPRVMNRVGDGWRLSLDLSCPEAARVVLLNPEPISFEDAAYREGSIRPGTIPSLDISGLKASPEPYGLFTEIQRFVISLLQDRSYPLWKRLFRVGLLCAKLDDVERGEWGPDSMGALQQHINGLHHNALSDLLEKCPADPKKQLETVLDLVVARITTDASPRRFFECYQEFMEGIHWTSKSTMNEMANCYTEAFQQHYAPFMNRHEHLLEHYLVTYVHRTLFPFGIAESNQRMRVDRVPSVITARYMLMVAYYAITQTLLIGNAGFHKSSFGAAHVLKAIQSCAKTFEHSITYPARVIGMLAEKSMTAPASLCVLFRTSSAEPASQCSSLASAEMLMVNR
jgi:lysine-N-methylase